MDKEYIKTQEEKCIQDCPPGCQSLCPLHVDVRKMIDALTREDFTLALEVYEKAVLFPGILSRLCDSPCLCGCTREELGGSIQIAGLEEAAVLYGVRAERKSRILRRRTERIAVIGGGLCGMSAAYYLYEKGYNVGLFEKKLSLGGRCLDFNPEKVSPEVIEKDVSVFSRTTVDIKLGCIIEKAEMQNFSRRWDAVLVACGSTSILGADLEADNETFTTQYPGLFAAGSLLRMEYSPSSSMSDGKRAAISIDRYLQAVSMTAGREGELTFDSCLFTNTEGRAPEAACFSPGRAFSREEAVTEAGRCLLCECMECVAACKLLEYHESYPRRYVRELSNSVNQFYGVRKTKHMLNGCTDCGLCSELCPNDLSMGEICTIGKRELVERGIMPPAIHDFPIQDMIYSNSEQCSLKICPEKADYIYFPGCQMQALMSDLLIKSYETILEITGGRAGLYLGCCGAPADWAGRLPLRDEVLFSFLSWWEACGKPVIIYACSSCRKVLSHVVGDESLLSIWEFFDKNLPEDSLPPSGEIPVTLAIADPCTARHLPKLRESARNLFRRQGCELVELPYSGEKTRCCGFGGLVSLTEPEVGRLMVEQRISESSEDYGLYCVMCQDNFSAEGKKGFHLLEVLYGPSLFRAEAGVRFPYSRRQENRRKAREEIRLGWAGEIPTAEIEAWEAVKLLIAADVLDIMEGRMILLRDLQRLVFEAERTGHRILNPKSGRYTASMKPGLVTYWAEYSAEGRAFRIHNSYSHRLEVKE